MEVTLFISGSYGAGHVMADASRPVCGTNLRAYARNRDHTACLPVRGEKHVKSKGPNPFYPAMLCTFGDDECAHQQGRGSSESKVRTDV